ncbi:MAG TPA: hypothetical protein VG225_07755 [Terracidiphilus sp.]|nr:hypothetical protein [Terracidiphilus sp.]
MAWIPLNPPAPDTFARRISWEAPTALQFWHLASLDAPTVAVSWSCGFAWVAHVRLPLWDIALLAMLVWVIYVADRLLDARAGMDWPPSHSLQHRHSFHWRHRRVLLALAGLATLAAAWIVLSRLPAAALGRDSIVGAATLAYFSGIHSRRRPAHQLFRTLARLVSREFLVGTLFSAGCLLPVLPLAAPSEPGAVYRLLALPALLFAALAWLNVRAIGCWEAPPASLRGSAVCRLALMLAAACLLSAMLVAGGEPRSAALLVAAALSALLLAVLDLRRQRMQPITLRASADLVLLTPLLLLPIAMLAK